MEDPLLEAQQEEVWYAVFNGSFVPTSVVNVVGTPKVKNSWNEDDKKKVFYDKKAKKLLQASLNMDEFVRVSKCKTMKEI